MIYGEMAYSEMEREAYTRGDDTLAQVLGELIDTQESIAEAEKAAEADKEKLEKDIEERDERIRELEDAMDRAYQLVESAARVSDRKAILDALAKP